jgi:fermentation-respiration switch protein FrsA (DUF1100 family)
MNIIIIFFLIILSIVIIFFLGVKFYEKKMIFFPFKDIEAFPSDYGIDFENIFFKTPDNIQINGWFIPSKSASKTILLFHGNAGNLSHRIEIIEMFSKLKVNSFIIDYRGYGKSNGKPSEKGIYIDAMASYEYLVNQKKIKPVNIIVYGKSLGTVVAIDLASKVKIDKLIVDSGLTSAKDMSKIIFPFLPLDIFLSVKFDSINKIKKVNCPKLFIHSTHDKTIPFSMGQQLFNMAIEPKQFYQSTGTHNEFLYINKTSISKILANFINQ